jgi:uncharacterized protein YlaI
MGTKVCSKCGVNKGRTEFYRDHKNKSGLFAACKPCIISTRYFTKYNKTEGELKKLFKKQGSKCEICRRKLSWGTKHVDHDHLTNRLRGFLCSDCNTSLGKLGDTLEGVMRAVKYLQFPPLS